MTYNVQFPNLGWSFKIHDVAFNIGGLSVKWYGILIATGFLLAFLYGMTSCKKMRIDQDKLLDVIIVGLIGGIIGARLYYVAFDTSGQYIKDPMSIFYITNGGLGIYGGIIGGMIFGGIMAKIRKISVPAVLDVASLGFLIGQAIGRWGNFFNQEAFGSKTNLLWAMESENTDAIAGGAVHPCFLYESLWCIAGLILLHIFTRKFRRYDGQTFLGYVIWYGIGRFFIEGLRTDSLLTPLSDYRISQIVAVASVAAAIVLLIVFRNRTALTGCGSKKVMALNSIVDEVPEEQPDDGVSTIFGELGNDADETDALADEDNSDSEEIVAAPEENTATEEKDDSTQAEQKEQSAEDSASEKKE
ncbi:MAG TPA: prolipoprotein diacylglyceryl transferase [Oscillospiraceae bacterium]|nr:prolipoprotein diacylglyceryl transferase [Oscillospiraceae bacterium]